MLYYDCVFCVRNIEADNVGGVNKDFRSMHSDKEKRWFIAVMVTTLI